MAYSEQLAERIRQALHEVPKVAEKKMFGGLGFMVDDKMCINAGPGRIMCRIDPALHDQALEKPGAKTVFMKGREYRGYLHVSEENLQTDQDLNYWIDLALDFNKRAKSSKK